MRLHAVFGMIMGSVVFGLLLELREQTSGTGARAAVAALAGACLGLTLVWVMKTRSP
jgi:hypothetical protein